MDELSIIFADAEKKYSISRWRDMSSRPLPPRLDNAGKMSALRHQYAVGGRLFTNCVGQAPQGGWE
jgi:hypothetical protein